MVAASPRALLLVRRLARDAAEQRGSVGFRAPGIGARLWIFGLLCVGSARRARWRWR